MFNAFRFLPLQPPQEKPQLSSDPNTLENLLKRWAELEPDRVADEGELNHYPGELQEAIQRAIVDRGFRGFELRYSSLGAVHWSARIRPFRSDLPDVIVGVHEAEPTIALLAAYVEALEATLQNGGGSES